MNKDVSGFMKKQLFAIAVHDANFNYDNKSVMYLELSCYRFKFYLTYFTTQINQFCLSDGSVSVSPIVSSFVDSLKGSFP